MLMVHFALWRPLMCIGFLLWVGFGYGVACIVAVGLSFSDCASAGELA